MQTIKCPDCGNVVSKDTDVCPNCGYAFPQVSNTKNNTAENIQSTNSISDENMSSMSAIKSKAVDEWLQKSSFDRFLVGVLKYNKAIEIVTSVVVLALIAIMFFVFKKWNENDILEKMVTYNNKLASMQTCAVFIILLVAYDIEHRPEAIMRIRLKNYLIRCNAVRDEEFDRICNSVVLNKDVSVTVLTEYLTAMYVCQNRNDEKYMHMRVAIHYLGAIATTVCLAVCASNNIHNFMVSELTGGKFEFEYISLIIFGVFAVARVAYAIWGSMGFDDRREAWLVGSTVRPQDAK